MTKEEEKRIWLDNYKKIERLIDLHVEQVKKSCSENWWPILIENETYKFLIGKLVELRQMATEHWGVDWVKQFPTGIYEKSGSSKGQLSTARNTPEH